MMSLCTSASRFDVDGDDDELRGGLWGEEGDVTRVIYTIA